MKRHLLALLAVMAVLTGLAPAVRAQTPAPSIEYYHLDALGSVRAVTDYAGVVLRRHEILPFGEEWTEDGTPGPDEARLFTGKERDTETGLDYFGARYCRADVGRFTTVDPVYTWQENLTDPQRWNRYAYVRNNPLRYTDPDGREIVWATDSERDRRYVREALILAVMSEGGSSSIQKMAASSVVFELGTGSLNSPARINDARNGGGELTFGRLSPGQGGHVDLKLDKEVLGEFGNSSHDKAGKITILHEMHHAVSYAAAVLSKDAGATVVPWHIAALGDPTAAESWAQAQAGKKPKVTRDKAAEIVERLVKEQEKKP